MSKSPSGSAVLEVGDRICAVVSLGAQIVEFKGIFVRWTKGDAQIADPLDAASVNTDPNSGPSVERPFTEVEFLVGLVRHASRRSGGFTIGKVHSFARIPDLSQRWEEDAIAREGSFASSEARTGDWELDTIQLSLEVLRRAGYGLDERMARIERGMSAYQREEKNTPALEPQATAMSELVTLPSDMRQPNDHPVQTAAKNGDEEDDSGDGSARMVPVRTDPSAATGSSNTVSLSEKVLQTESHISQLVSLGILRTLREVRVGRNEGAKGHHDFWHILDLMRAKKYEEAHALVARLSIGTDQVTQYRGNWDTAVLMLPRSVRWMFDGGEQELRYSQSCQRAIIEFKAIKGSAKLDSKDAIVLLGQEKA